MTQPELASAIGAPPSRLDAVRRSSDGTVAYVPGTLTTVLFPTSDGPGRLEAGPGYLAPLSSGRGHRRTS